MLRGTSSLPPLWEAPPEPLLGKGRSSGAQPSQNDSVNEASSPFHHQNRTQQHFPSGLNPLFPSVQTTIFLFLFQAFEKVASIGYKGFKKPGETNYLLIIRAQAPWWGGGGEGRAHAHLTASSGCPAPACPTAGCSAPPVTASSSGSTRTSPPSHSDVPRLSFAPHSLGLALVSLCTELGSEVAIFCASAQLTHHLAFGGQEEHVTCHFFPGRPHWIRIACTLPK